MAQNDEAKGWSNIREQRGVMLREINAQLSEDERKVFQKVLELNINGRHQTAPRVRKPLYDFVSEAIR